MTTEQDQDTDDIQPGEVDVDLDTDDESTEGESATEPASEEPRKTRRERREEHASRRIEEQVNTRLEAAKQELRAEYEARYNQQQRQAPQVEEKKPAEPDEVSKLRRQSERLIRLMKDPDTSDEEVKDLKKEYQDIQETMVVSIAKRAIPPQQAPQSPSLLPVLQAEFSDIYGSDQLLQIARKRHELLRSQRPGVDDYILARQSLSYVRAAKLAHDAKTAKPSADVSAKFGSASSMSGARESSAATSVRLTKQQRDLAISTYSDKVKWSDEKKIQTWAKKQRDMGYL